MVQAQIIDIVTCALHYHFLEHRVGNVYKHCCLLLFRVKHEHKIGNYLYLFVLDEGTIYGIEK